MQAARAASRPRNRGLAWAAWWRVHSNAIWIGLPLAVLVCVVLVVLNLRLHSGPPTSDVNSLHADILAHRSGAEVTFTGVLVSDPTESGGHERMLVHDQLGDTLELDYNTSLGRSVPAHAGQSVVVHGQLYVDTGQVGVHCLHAQTSRGCPEPGWIQFAGATYS